MSPNDQRIVVISICLTLGLSLVAAFWRRRRNRPGQHTGESPSGNAGAAGDRFPASSPANGPEGDRHFPGADHRDYVFGALTPVLASLLPVTSESRAATTKILAHAGYYSPHAWQNFAAIRYLSIVLPVLLFLVLLVIAPVSLEPLIVAGLAAGPVLGWSIPGLVLRGKGAERLREIELGMPDMLDLLNMCVSQGMTVPAALGRVGRELAPVYPALSKELNIVNEQARIGSLEQALVSFSTRIDVPEVHSLTSLLTQTERMGTSISQALTDYGDGIRENFKQRADAKAAAATFKLLFPTVFCLMPAVFMFLLGPAVIELNRFFREDAANVLNAGERVGRITDQQ